MAKVNERLTRNWLRLLVVTLALVVLLVLGITAYLAHIRGTAAALIESARDIRSTEDAQRQIAAWRKRQGEQFWQENDHPGGQHSYDGQIENLLISRLPIFEPTVVTVGITMQNGKLQNLAVILQSVRYPTASVWVQEWFDSDVDNRVHVRMKYQPLAAIVEFSASIPEAKREKTFALNTKCFIRPRGCGSAEDILPGIWQLDPVTDH
jgi:hypothetical protein